MKWIKVRVDYFSDNLEETKAKLVNMFNEIGINQVEVIDYFSENELDYNANFSSKNDVWSIIGYVVDNRFANTKLNIIFNNLKEFMENENEFMYEIFTAKCNDEDWQDEWKKYFHTVNITDNIVIKPSWDEYEPSDNEIVVEIDPGLAFGTGTHETTSLCVEFLEKLPERKTVSSTFVKTMLALMPRMFRSSLAALAQSTVGLSVPALSRVLMA